MNLKRTAIYTTLATIALGWSAQPMAAETLEEVFVTARKQEESLQTTPVAVTALSEQMLKLAQVTDIADLRRTTPNLSIMEGGTGSSSLVFIAIRGNAQNAPNGAADAAVGTYIDGVYFARPTGGNLDLLDVQRAEVLRGPQGTLFGRNTTGGAINIVTNKPTDEMEGYLKAEAGDYDSYRVEGVVNLPLLQDELAARFSARYSERGEGYGEYKGYTDPDGFVWDGLDQEAGEVKENSYGRALVRWSPAELNFEAILGGWYLNMEDTGQRTEVLGINSNFQAGPFFLSQPLAAIGFDPQNFINQQRPNDAYWNADNSTQNPVYNDPWLAEPASTNKNQGIYLNLDFELGDYNLKSITAWHDTRSTGTVDLDGTPINLLTFNSVWDQDQFSQEFQLSGEYGDNLNWITGAYYFQEDSVDKSRSRAFGLFADWLAPGAPPELARAPVNAGTDTDNDNSSTGVFAQANYDLTDKLRLTTGLRWTWDSREITWQGRAPETSQYNPDDLANCIIPDAAKDKPGVCAQTNDADFDYPAWVVSLDYQYSDTLFLYAKTSGASMAGGWNVRSTIAPAFDPEDVKDVEVGFKADLLDNTLRLNTALFYMWAKDQQRTVNAWDTVTNSTTQYVRNASESEIAGAEFELSWLPWEGMTLTANLALLDAEYQDYEVLEGITTGPNAGQAVIVDHSGENPTHAPETTWGLAATQLIPLSFGELELHADYFWVDDTYFSGNTVRPGESEVVQQAQREEQQFHAIESYGLVNAIATLRLADDTWEFSLWGKNLADEEYHVGISNFYTAFGPATAYWGAPRTWGGSVQYRW